MLVLTRKPMQQIRIGNDITVTVVKVERNTIRIAIEAPRDVRILRGELEPFATAVLESPDPSTDSNSGDSTENTTRTNETPVRRSLALRRDQRNVGGTDRSTPRAPAHPLRWSIASMRQRTEVGASPASSSPASASPLVRANR